MKKQLIITQLFYVIVLCWNKKKFMFMFFETLLFAFDKFHCVAHIHIVPFLKIRNFRCNIKTTSLWDTWYKNIEFSFIFVKCAVLYLQFFR